MGMFVTQNKVFCEHIGADCVVGEGCIPVQLNRVCPRMKQTNLQYFNPAQSMAIIWCIEDVKSEDIRPDLTDAQAMEVLDIASDNHDANYGIGWSTLQDLADEAFPKEGE